MIDWLSDGRSVFPVIAVKEIKYIARDIRMINNRTGSIAAITCVLRTFVKKFAKLKFDFSEGNSNTERFSNTWFNPNGFGISISFLRFCTGHAACTRFFHFYWLSSIQVSFYGHLYFVIRSCIMFLLSLTNLSLFWTQFYGLNVCLMIDSTWKIYENEMKVLRNSFYWNCQDSKCNCFLFQKKM